MNPVPGYCRSGWSAACHATAGRQSCPQKDAAAARSVGIAHKSQKSAVFPLLVFGIRLA
jgi:hypothetical protein